jgi:hypothetical protein
MVNTPNSIIKSYAFTEADKQHLTDLLAKSYLLAKTQAYQKAIASTKHVVTIHQPWQPSESDVTHAQQWASEQVDSIAETYEEMLQHAIEQMAEEPQEAIGDVIGKAKKKAKDLADQIAQWFLVFLPWKTKQIATQTWGTGANDGTNEFIEEVQGSKKAGSSDGTTGSDNNVEGDTSLLRVIVLPAHSSSDECAAIAGKQFALGKAPDLPMHINCIHYKEIILTDDER